MSSSTQVFDHLNQNQFYNNLNSIMNEILLEDSSNNFDDKQSQYKHVSPLSPDEFSINESNYNLNEAFISKSSSTNTNNSLENSSDHSLLKSTIFMINSQSDVIKGFRHAFLEVYLEKNKVGRKSKKINSTNSLICVDSTGSISTPTTPLTPKTTTNKLFTNSVDSKYTFNVNLNSCTSHNERRDRINSKSKISSRLGNRSSIKKLNNLANITNKEPFSLISNSGDNNNKTTFSHQNKSKSSTSFSHLPNTCTMNENINSSSSNYYDDSKLSNPYQTASNSLPTHQPYHHFSSSSSYYSPYSLNNYGENAFDPSPDLFENDLFDKRDNYVYSNDLSSCSMFDMERKRFDFAQIDTSRNITQQSYETNDEFKGLEDDLKIFSIELDGKFQLF